MRQADAEPGRQIPRPVLTGAVAAQIILRSSVLAFHGSEQTDRDMLLALPSVCVWMSLD